MTARLAGVIAALAVLVLVGSCSAGPAAPPPAAPVSSPTPSPTASPAASPAVSPAVSPAPPAYRASISALPAAVAAEMTGVSWRPGCPVPLSALRLVRLTYWGFDNAAHQGELVVHRDVAARIVRIFEKLYAARFPIRSMVRVDAYGGSDDRSMAGNNTSMFNCRYAWGTTTWSVHAYGKAIDINPVQNPYLPRGLVLPSVGATYLDRGRVRAGMIVRGDVVTRAFAAEGFRWGGDRRQKDYQHFDVAP